MPVCRGGIGKPDKLFVMLLSPVGLTGTRFGGGAIIASTTDLGSGAGVAGGLGPNPLGGPEGALGMRGGAEGA